MSEEKGKVILVTGGSGSGKSLFSEKLLEDEKEILYIATAVVNDEESERRVEHHKNRRDERYRTHEGFEELANMIENAKEDTVLLDCISLFVRNHMFKQNRDYDFISLDEVDEIKNCIEEELKSIINICREKNKKLVMVTNEVGYSVVPEFKVNRIFRNLIGTTNQLMASLSDKVYLVSCGIPITLK